MGDRYEIEDLVGQGGMGVVLRARHRFTNERVALKMLHPHLSMRADLAARFLAEARAPAAIGHPGIVRVLDAGTTERGEHYFAMELLEGEPLASIMRRGPMPFEKIRNICLDVLDALGSAHAAGFIHRDLKPENVFINAADGRTKLLDFGIAKSLGDLDSQSHTATGTSMGTLHYMSPEQLKNAKRVDHRTDLWAVGVMFYQMVTGQLPYLSESAGEMLLQVLSSPPRPLEERLLEVPATLAAFLGAALAVDPVQRFESAATMAGALRAMPSVTLRYREGVVPSESGAHHPVAPTLTAGPGTPGVTSPTDERPGSSRKLLFILAGVIVLVFVVPILGGFLFWFPKYLEDRTRTAVATQGVAQGLPCPVACHRINQCGAVFNLADCVDFCEASAQTRECVRDADCAKVGVCFIEGYCGKKPSGTSTCREVFDEEFKCPVEDKAANKDCVCRAMYQVRPTDADKLVINNSCSFTTCQTECAGLWTSPEDCRACFTKSCAPQVAACRNR